MDELADRLPHCNEFDSTRLAVRALLREERIEEVPAGPGQRLRYRCVERHQDLVVDDDWEVRIDALYEHMEAVTETIRRRFLADEADSAGGRTFSFRARPDDMEAFRDELFEFVRTRYSEMEARAHDAEDARVYALYAGMTPTDAAVEG